MTTRETGRSVTGLIGGTTYFYPAQIREIVQDWDGDEVMVRLSRWEGDVSHAWVKRSELAVLLFPDEPSIPEGWRTVSGGAAFKDQTDET